MLGCRFVVTLFVVIVLLVSGSTAAHGQEAFGSECATQAENDVLVRNLFGPLLMRFPSVVGRPVRCIVDAPDGGLAQKTTTGLLYARPEGGGPVRIVVFTDGHRHWAVDANLSRVTLYWEGDAPFPPAEGVTRIPVSPADAQAEAAWPPSPAPTVGRPAPTPVAAHRPATGENIAEPAYGGGRGELLLGNELPVDVAFKMRDDDGARGTRAFVYVRAGEQAKLEGISPGTYQFQGIAGSDWDPEARVFRRGLMVFKADQPFEFTEERTEEGVTWMTGTFSVRQVEGGSNVGISTIDLADFQKE
ncbi:MAG TPA: hypothetical protein VFH48_25075 [Chloroflexota bacterium]|nr:hypothetical protein [Chloroflexota bacterium]